ncbi:hypothetical protein D8674_019078 [Pyrus ussuriensis x Pyrus communis]|uniref:Uncharacterized protein n=1 Tax=Pyrus ussuriensis x Pyrus communis TaxID=2448454 RepID=A0A5N5G6Q7_9ROSA|nr:hypothetical protein D8674_019078 [Pyrus ussuriensis x Pyrus communis]
MSSLSDCRLDLNVVEEVAISLQDNIWHPSFLFHTGPLTIRDSVMKNDMTTAVVAKNLLTPKDNRLLSKRSNELAVKDSLALSVQCEIRGLKHENKQLHMLAHSYGTNMKRKLDQLQEFEGQILSDHQRFCSLVERDSGIVLHHLQMSESGSPNDEGFPSSSSRFRLAMLESSWPLLESCTKETLDDFRNCQTLANIGFSSFMSAGVKLPLHPWLQRMLSFIGYVSGQLNPGFWGTLIGFYIIWMECGLGEPSFHQWRYCYKMRPVKACPGDARQH